MLTDLRYAIRLLRKTPGFTLVAVLSLALGMGTNSAIFSFVDTLLLRPLPVARPNEVLTITGVGRDQPDKFQTISYREYLDFRDQSKTMTDFVAVSLFRVGYSLSPEALPKVKTSVLVSGNLFQAMGVVPVLGRAFRPDEDKVPGRDAVVVLGYDFWRDEFGSDRNVIGRILRINGADFAVIGVAPEQFTGLDPYFKAAMFLPAIMSTRVTLDPGGPFAMLEERGYRVFQMQARFKTGVTPAQAEARLVSIAQNLAQTYPSLNK